MNSRASKNIIYSKGKSSGIMPKIIGGIRKLKNAYVTSHKRKQAKLDARYPRVDIEMGF